MLNEIVVDDRRFLAARVPYVMRTRPGHLVQDETRQDT